MVAINQVNNNARKTLIAILESNDNLTWIYKRILLCIKNVNKKYLYNIDYNKNRKIEILKYQPWDFFSPHADNRWTSKNRQITAIVQLSDIWEYSGWELKFTNWNITPPKKQGSLIMFPSILEHEVTPILQGNRYTLVIWF